MRPPKEEPLSTPLCLPLLTACFHRAGEQGCILTSTPPSGLGGEETPNSCVHRYPPPVSCCFSQPRAATNLFHSLRSSQRCQLPPRSQSSQFVVDVGNNGRQNISPVKSVGLKLSVSPLFPVCVMC